MTPSQQKTYNKAIFDVVDLIHNDFKNHSSYLSRGDEDKNQEFEEMIVYILKNLVK